ncbi:MAG: calcium/sodium antiporter [Bacteroidales bacterium]|nr:calcium/sodium antiporter [Bacteroidales bacterium]HOL98341.1 calcium/sodium antiporter [Bacteroidales bacterium]HOM35721.1 calcium/sodium antiporter [Bacteroidales bacterium]HPD23139.1 calcium/sodium antiporter [Bacteroidales bacterium]HRS99068.1 calcium/sodium antiporter [Bacteroidales bacterium]
MDYLFLILGLAILIISGDFLVKNAIGLAKYFKVSDFIISATVIAIGTSLPELFVSVNAGINGFADITVGNIVGSNIANIGFVLAVSGLIIGITTNRDFLIQDLLILIFVSLLFVIFLSDQKLNRIEGVILLVLFIVFIVYNILKSKKQFKLAKIDEYEPIKQKHPLLAILIILISSAGLMYGSDFLVNSSVNIARSFGVSERVIAVTMVAVGTSLPEFVTSIIAALRKNVSVILGNIVGSNIINILFIGGLSAVVEPLKISPQMVSVDLLGMLFFAVLLLTMFVFPRKYKIGFVKSLMLIIFYFAYILSLV